jgi:hypothetical protein
MIVNVAALQLIPIDPIVLSNIPQTIKCCYDRYHKYYPLNPDFIPLTNENYLQYLDFMPTANNRCGVKIVNPIKPENLYNCSFVDNLMPDTSKITFTNIYVVNVSKTFDLAVENIEYVLTCHDGPANPHFIYVWSYNGNTIGNKNQYTILANGANARKNYNCIALSYGAMRYYGDLYTTVKESGFSSTKQLNTISLKVVESQYILTILSTKELVVKWFVNKVKQSCPVVYTNLVIKSKYTNDVIQSNCTTDGYPVIHIEYEGYTQQFTPRDFGLDDYDETMFKDQSLNITRKDVCRVVCP